jgi:hypothetical protein
MHCQGMYLPGNDSLSSNGPSSPIAANGCWGDKKLPASKHVMFHTRKHTVVCYLSASFTPLQENTTNTQCPVLNPLQVAPPNTQCPVLNPLQVTPPTHNVLFLTLYK